MTYVLHRHTKASYPVAVKGDGVYLIDAQGKRYLDGSSGAAVSCLGHSNQAVRNAIKDQVDTLAYAHTGFFTTEPMEQLAELLVKKSPENIGSVYFVSGGSEAVEGAIKLARQYFLEMGKPQKSRIIARYQSYHGNTLGALSAGGNAWRRKPFEPILVPAMSHISPCYAYRGQAVHESEEAYGLRVADELEKEITKYGADTVAAFIAEPVVGATLGCVPAVKGYFKRIREICRKHNVLLILDEVMCGMGRTGSLFACEQEDITADLITVAKGLGGGYQPIGAIMISKEIIQSIEQGSGYFQHGHTYIGHATACRASLAVQQEIEKYQLLDNVKKQGAYLASLLYEQVAPFESVGNIRGRGLFYGIEFVQNKETKEPFDTKLKINARIRDLALEKGVMCYAMGGTLDGQRGDHIMLAPPYIITKEQIETLVDVISTSIKQVSTELAANFA